MGRPSRAARTALAVGGWLAAACVALAVGLVAVSALGRGILEPGPPMVEPGEVEAELANPPPPADAEPAPDSPGPPEAILRAQHVERTPGGTVLMACARSGQVSLLSWSPAQGFRVDDVQDEPDEEAEITFTTGERDVEVVVACRGGRPHATVEIDD